MHQGTFYDGREMLRIVLDKGTVVQTYQLPLDEDTERVVEVYELDGSRFPVERDITWDTKELLTPQGARVVRTIREKSAPRLVKVNEERRDLW